MKSAKNIIDKIFLDFTYTANDRNRNVVTDETRSFFYNNLLPKIDALISERAGNSNIRIDSISIDLDKVALEDLPDRLIAELGAELGRLKQYAPIDQNKRTDIIAGADSVEKLVYFLQTGTFPWHHDKAVPPEKLLSQILKKNKPVIVAQLRQLFKADQTALERFILQFPNSLLNEVFAALIPENGKLLYSWYSFVVKNGQIHSIVETFRFAAALEDFTDTATTFIRIFAEELLLPYLKANKTQLPEIMGNLERTAQGDHAEESSTHPKALELFKRLANEYTNKKPAALSQHNERNSLAEEQFPPDHTEVKISNHTTSFPVDNAGLVTLFPYLQMFFTELGLMREEIFINNTAQLKAAQVLQYLATGTHKTPEHLLALNKTMCGIDMAMPCPGKIQLTTDQKQACKVLLNAVINNWSPVKGTSIDGFRQSFLQRNGTLRKDEGNWILHVERKSIDILLDDLPWGFSVMKFPWNDYLIHVQW